NVVERQLEIGIDVGNNGEQQREGFFLYVQRRMTGFGGSWRRWPRQDVERYPEYKRMAEAHDRDREGVTSLVPPCVIGEVRYRDPALAENEPRELRQTLNELQGGFREAFMSAPSPGIIAS